MSPMKNFITLNDLASPIKTIQLAKSCKKDPFGHVHLGQRKTIGLLFFNPSLRTRLSTQKAAKNLGLDIMVMNFSNEAWAKADETGNGNSMDDAAIDALIRARKEAREVSDFAKADEIRDQLARVDIILEDSNDGTLWRRR